MQIGSCYLNAYQKKKKKKKKDPCHTKSIRAVVLFVPLVVLNSCSDSTLHLLLRGENTKRGAGKHSTHANRTLFNGSKYLY